MIAYQQTYLGYNLGELGPGYDCGVACSRPEKTALSGCPACKRTVIEQGYERLVDEQIAKGQPDDEDECAKWPRHEVERDVAMVRSLLADSRNRINRKWPARVAHLARVVLGAERKAVNNIKWQILKDLK